WTSYTEIELTANQTDAARRPTWVADGINGNPMVRFDGDNDRLMVSQNPLRPSDLPRTLFVVLESDDFRGHILGSGVSYFGRLTLIGYGLGIFAYKPFLKARDYD